MAKLVKCDNDEQMWQVLDDNAVENGNPITDDSKMPDMGTIYFDCEGDTHLVFNGTCESEAYPTANELREIAELMDALEDEAAAGAVGKRMTLEEAVTNPNIPDDAEFIVHGKWLSTEEWVKQVESRKKVTVN